MWVLLSGGEHVEDADMNNAGCKSFLLMLITFLGMPMDQFKNKATQQSNWVVCKIQTIITT